jgi:hypothetical protein
MGMMATHNHEFGEVEFDRFDRGPELVGDLATFVRGWRRTITYLRRSNLIFLIVALISVNRPWNSFYILAIRDHIRWSSSVPSPLKKSLVTSWIKLNREK